MILAAGHKDEVTKGMSYVECPTCFQDYTGKMQMGLTEKTVQIVHYLPETDERKIQANRRLAMATMASGNYAEAETIHRKLMLIQCAVYGAAEPDTIHVHHHPGRRHVHRRESL